MSKKFFQLFLIFFALSSFSTSVIKAADTPIPAPVPIACPDEKNPEFNSLRPYQASPCGGSVEARMCSNDLIFTESFEFANKGCSSHNNTGTFPCNVNHKVGSHNLFVDLSNTMLPILGNTEQVKNSATNIDSIDDATKMNEYVSWYLNGVTNHAENGNSKNTNDSIINFSGPIQKLMPQSILEAQRIKTIESIGKTSSATDDTGNTTEEVANHNQIAVCYEKQIPFLPYWLTNLFGTNAKGLGKATPIECYKGNSSGTQGSYLRLSNWDTTPFEIAIDEITKFLVKTVPGPILGQLISSSAIADRWPKKIPPLPWEFTKVDAYTKAYNEWRGDLCAYINLPIVGNKLFCAGIPGVTNSDFADLFPYIPLANTVDKKGVELVNGVQIQPSGGTQLSDHGYGETKNAPLFFAHTEEVKNLSEFLNSSYTPKGFTSKPLSETTEKNVCSAVNVRTNQGDNLFPEATHGIEVDGVYYTISQVECTETFTQGTKTGCGKDDLLPCPPKDELKCPAEVTITIKTDTKSPWLDNIFSTTVADSGSTFRKIFPKVGENAPVTCIADIPGVTNVTHDSTKSQKPAGGGQTFEVGNVPADGGATPDSPQLTFPHLGSVYDYFLKGIQTALRPKGYGEPIESGTLCATIAAEKECTAKAVSDSAIPQKYLGPFKSNFIDLANRWSAKCPGAQNNMAEKCYNYVVDESAKAGINPAFTLSVWLNESGASNYCEGGATSQDFGVNLSSLYQNITGQLKKFLTLPAAFAYCKSTPGWKEPMEAFLSRFQSSAGACNPNDSVATQYYEGFKNTTWQFVTGTACMKNGNFAITWPTDNSCPK